MEGRKNGKVGKDKQGGKGEGKWGWEGSGPPHLSEVVSPMEYSLTCRMASKDKISFFQAI